MASESLEQVAELWYPTLVDLLGVDGASTAAAAVASCSRSAPAQASTVDGAPFIVSLYPDQVRTDDHPSHSPLRESMDWLSRSVLRGLSGAVVHVLPPFVSDPGDAFSIVDEGRICPHLGDWSDFEPVGGHALLLDFVFNQRSIHSPLFERYRRQLSSWTDCFFSPDPTFDFSRITGPRGRRPLVSDRLADGTTVNLWSAHGGLQRDLNYRSGALVAWVTERLAELAQRSSWVRFDGVAFMWKESGTTCVNTPEAIALSQYFAALWKALRPEGSVIAEVDDAASGGRYLAGGANRPDYSYDYALPGLIALALFDGDVLPLAEHLHCAGDRGQASWLNVAATHDGMSLRPWAPTISVDRLEPLLRGLERQGSAVWWRDGPHGRTPYEIDALPADVAASAGRGDADARRLADLATSVLLLARGVPFLYLPALMGQRARPLAPGSSEPRDAVRGEIDVRDAGHVERLRRFRLLALLRRKHRPLWTASAQRVLHAGDGLLAFARGDEGRLVVLLNFASEDRFWALSRVRAGDGSHRATVGPELRVPAWSSAVLAPDGHVTAL